MGNTLNNRAVLCMFLPSFRGEGTCSRLSLIITIQAWENVQFAPSQLCTARDGQSTYSILEDLEADMAPNGFVPWNPNDQDPFGSQYPSNPDTIVSAPIRTLDHLPSLYAEQAELNSMQGHTLQLNHTQTQMMGNSEQQQPHLTSMQSPNRHINPAQLQTRGNDDFQQSNLSSLQFTTVGNLSYNPSELQPGSAIQSAPNQIQTPNAYQSSGPISSVQRPALHRPLEQEQRPIHVNLNDTQYQWGPTSNVNQPQRNDQMPVGSQYPNERIPTTHPYHSPVARIQYPRDPIEQDRFYNRPQQNDHYNTSTRYIPNARPVYPDYQDLETLEQPPYRNDRPAYPREPNVKLEKTKTKSVNLPKSLWYNGNTSWQAFYAEFSKYAESQSWRAKQCKDHLYWCLEGEAGEFFF